MKVTRKLETPTDVVEDVFCNKCGLSCKSPQGDYYGLIEATVTGGYSSVGLGDGDVHTFSLCEHCVSDLIGKFKYRSLQGNYLFPEEPHVEGFTGKDPVGAITTFQDVLDALGLEAPSLDSGEPFDTLYDDEEIVELVGNLPPKVKKEDMN